MQASCKGKQSAKHDTLIESSLRSVTPMKIRMASYLSLACFAVLLLGLDDGIGHRGRTKLLHHLGTNQPLACSEGTIPFLLPSAEGKTKIASSSLRTFPTALEGFATSLNHEKQLHQLGEFRLASFCLRKWNYIFSKYRSWIHNAMRWMEVCFFPKASDVGSTSQIFADQSTSIANSCKVHRPITNEPWWFQSYRSCMIIVKFQPVDRSIRFVLPSSLWASDWSAYSAREPPSS